MLRKITEHSFSIMKINVDVHTQMPFPQQLYHSVCHIGISCSTGHTGRFCTTTNDQSATTHLYGKVEEKVPRLGRTEKVCKIYISVSYTP